MNDHLKQFANHSAYAAVESGLILPNVSLCVQENEVHYKPYIDPYGGHEYVEIGGLKWATMNIGANSVTDTGLYFQWGDTQGYTAEQVGSGEGKKYFGWADYKYGNGTSSPGATGMTKYNATDGKTVLDAEDDAATANWGGNWRMPTTADFQALGAACKIIDASGVEITDSYKLTTLNGVTGIYVEDKTDSSKRLFFPLNSNVRNGRIYNGNGDYFSSSLNSSTNAYRLFFSSGGVYWDNGFGGRSDGGSIRPVAD